MDVREIRRDGLSLGRGVALVADAAAVFVPLLPAGAGVALRASGAAHDAQRSAAAAGRSWTTQRRAFWKAESVTEGALQRWGGQTNVDRMRRGLAPQIGGRSVELHHTPTPFRLGGVDVIPVTPAQHAQIDPFRRI